MNRSCRWVEEDKVLIITQNGKHTPYHVTNLEPDERVAHPGFRLHKPDGEFYDVHVDKFGPHCTCADHEYRNRECKHVAALRAIGKITKETHDESQPEEDLAT